MRVVIDNLAFSRAQFIISDAIGMRTTKFCGRERATSFRGE
jgi:hypothetical protein